MTTPEEHTAIVATDGKGHIDTIQVPTPKPGPGEVLIKVDYAAFIAFDTYITDIGYYVSDFPHTLGHDAAGTVIKVGEGVKNLRVGDRVSIANNKAMLDALIGIHRSPPSRTALPGGKALSNISSSHIPSAPKSQTHSFSKRR
jgi:NADPH:quinone reductase-like Zn-dependent oxidoreductase